MKENTFPKISLKGTPEERGFQHGQQISEKIHATVEFYARIFNESSEAIFSKASYFQEKISAFHLDYCKEIEALAEAASINPLWIYALNARTEILSMGATECTALYFPKSRLLGQNWDWASHLEELTVLMEIERLDGHKILMISEPGIIGKIGMNSAGVGACLNILRINQPLKGVPIHVVMRAVLDAQSMKAAKEAVAQSGVGKSSHILLGDDQGEGWSVEFAGNEVFELQTKHNFVHTNHYLQKEINKDQGKFRSSFARLRTAQNAIERTLHDSLETMKQILLDQSDLEFPICRPDSPHPILEEVATLCSILMDLQKRKIYLKKGHISEHDFYCYSL